jgi:hypothetical protein
MTMVYSYKYYISGHPSMDAVQKQYLHLRILLLIILKCSG